ncbi:CU044_5270 family protein [Streptomyces sp. NPDC060131]|uniref:CU044_5270 family protein n=2 Tax=unclassified Streptomyces TaxID=2593676 RepID=UPI0036631983
MNKHMSEHDVDVLDFPGADRLRAAADVAPPSPEAVGAALTAIRAAAANSGTVVPLAARPPRRVRRILVSAAAVAAIAAGVAVYPVIGVGSSPPAAEANAVGFLHSMADTAGAESVSNAPYWKVERRTSVTSPVPGRVYPTETATEWLGRDSWLSAPSGSGEVMEFQGLANGWTSSDSVLRHTGHRVAQPGRHEQTSWRVGGFSSRPVIGEFITWDELKALPTEPEALRAELLGDAAGPEAEQDLFNGIDALLSNAPAGPRLRAALYEVLAGIPDVRLAGDVKDSAGRDGTAVELTRGHGSSRLIIDPRTARLLEATSVLRAGPKGDAGKVRRTYLSAGPAENAPPSPYPVRGVRREPRPSVRGLTPGP